jgi:TRAP-type C4-dicarboxylate transport system permease small subunit
MQHLSVTFFLGYNSRLGGFRLAWLHGSLSVFFFGLIFFLSLPVIDAFEGMYLLSVPIPISARYYAATVGSFFSVFVLVVNLVLLIKE